MALSVVSFISKLNLILFLYLDNIHPRGGHELNVIYFGVLNSIFRGG